MAVPNFINTTDVSPDTAKAAFDLVNSWVQYLSASLDPVSTAIFYEDFFGGQVQDSDVNHSTFDHKWATTGDTAFSFSKAVAKDGFGIVRLTTGAAINRTCYMYTPFGSAADLGIRNVAGVTYRAVVSAVTTTTLVEYYMGFNSDGNNIGRDGIYFTRTTGNWLLNCSKAGNVTTSDTGIAPVAGTFQKLEFRVNTAGTSVQAYIDNVVAGSPITTNIPIIGLALWCQVKTTEAITAKSMDVDCVTLTQMLSR